LKKFDLEKILKIDLNYQGKGIPHGEPKQSIGVA